MYTSLCIFDYQQRVLKTFPSPGKGYSRVRLHNQSILFLVRVQEVEILRWSSLRGQKQT